MGPTSVQVQCAPMLRRGFLLLASLLALAAAPPGVRTIPAPKVTEAAAALRTLGLAQLENERPRPENLVVLLQSGQRAVAAGDRAAATQAFLRVRELIESAPSPAATTVLGQVLTALEGNDLAAARVPAIRLENVLKPTPAYQQ